MEPVSAECSAKQMLNGRAERADCEREMFCFCPRGQSTPLAIGALGEFARQ